ncbi:MAG: OmpA family protein [Methylophilaceae bacterium]
MKKNMIKLAVAATLGLAAVAASAEGMYNGAWYVVPGVSYLNADSDLKANSNGGGVSLKIGKELSESWDVQGGIDYDTASANSGSNVGLDGRYKQTTLGADALYMFSRDSFRPFLLAGLGIARNKQAYTLAGADASASNTSWMANVGIGAQYLFNDTFGLQADLRHRWSRAQNLDVSTGAYGSNENVGNTLLSLGGIFRFGVPAPMPVAAVAPEPTPVAAVEPTPEPAPVVEPVKYETITVGAEKLFGFDKASLKAGAKPILDDAAAKIKANPEFKAVIVTGHADRLGSEAYNQKLSERRAKTVADYLVSQGVDSGIIQSSGKGKSMPVVECKGNKATKKLIACLQPNRRVEIRAEAEKEVDSK